MPLFRKREGFADFATTCLEATRSDVSPAWQTIRLTYLRAHFLPFFADAPLARIGPERIEAYKAHRLEEGARHSTVNKELAVLSTVFRKAFEWGRIRCSPLSGVRRLPRDRDGSGRAFDAEEASRLLVAARGEPLEAFVRISLYTGMRPGEVLRLRWRDVQISDGLIAVSHEPGHPTKTRRTRFVPIHPDLEGYLRRLPRPIDSSTPVAAWRTGLESRDLRRPFRRLLEKAGLDGATPYALRHTFATMVLRTGASIMHLQALLGHRSLEATRHYVHLGMTDHRRSIGRLDFQSPTRRAVVPKAGVEPAPGFPD